jgi:hypothetical protein
VHWRGYWIARGPMLRQAMIGWACGAGKFLCSSRRRIIVSISILWSINMIKKNTEDKRKYLLRLVVLLCLICLCLSCSTSISPPVMDSNISSEPNDVIDADQHGQDTAMRSATRAATGGFRPSLEMKENADFLLSPALLMQEALSEDIITTYPSE